MKVLHLAILSLANGFVVLQSAPIDSTTISSSRRTLNFGPANQVQSHSLIEPSANLIEFNQRGKFLIDTEPALIAAAFVQSLYPAYQFKAIDSYPSKNGISHNTFLAVIDGLPVSNAQINVNVLGAQVISYGDGLKSLNQKVEKRDQVIFNDNGPQGEGEVYIDELEEYSSPPLIAVEEAFIDPRHGLLAFLSLASPDEELTQFILTADRADVIEIMSITRSASSFIIDNVPSTVSPVEANLVYILENGGLTKAYKYIVESNLNHYEAYVSTTSNVGEEEVLMSVDWVRDFRPTGGEIGFAGMSFNSGSSSNLLQSAFKKADKTVPAPIPTATSTAKPIPSSNAKPSYKVFPWGVNDPSEGARQMLRGSAIDVDAEADPVGWHTIPGSAEGKELKFTDTRGNNVYAQENWEGQNNYIHNLRPDAGVNMSFAFGIHLPAAGIPLNPRSYINASVTELFYTCNEIHTLFYRYGFDEVAGNFQNYNFGKGGRGGDAVIAMAQDGSGVNNANFATPPDGTHPRMRMYTWNPVEPNRDGSFSSDVIIHEYSHGISTRLTGGPANSGCLGWGEAGGMGEGWGDFFATMIRQHSANQTDFAMGAWVSARPAGIRNFKYSRNMTTNQDTYKTLDKPGYWGVHAIGEVWAEMLFEVAENLIIKHGFESTLFPPALNTTSSFWNEKYSPLKVPKSGNTLAIQLVVDGMKLQPCRPAFTDARDAILLADEILTKGENYCEIYAGFAKRGLGPAAEVIGSTPWGGGRHTEDYKVPARC